MSHARALFSLKDPFSFRNFITIFSVNQVRHHQPSPNQFQASYKKKECFAASSIFITEEIERKKAMP